MAESSSSQNLPSTSKQPFHEKIYLETHSWHASRYHMISKWGYKLPHYSFNKAVTHSYRAITKYCLLQDISYYTCIEIVGEKNWLEAALREHCNPKKTFAENMYTNGQREGTVMFFKKNGYPRFPIGYVNFFWKLSETNIKTIWIWVHPAFYSDFLSEIISSFDFKQNNVRQGRIDISHNLNDLYTNDAGCEMRVLKCALNRFRLSGPTALTVLKEALHVPSLTELDLDSESCPMTEEQDSSLNDEKLDTSSGNNVSVQPLLKMAIDEKANKDLTIQDLKKKMWHTIYYKKRENIEAFKIQEQMWQSLKVLEPRFVLPNIIGLTVLDPRFYLPGRSTKTEIPSSAENLHSQLSNDLNRSPIWDAQIRQIVSSSCVSKHTINKIGMSDNPYFSKDTVTKIPILLIQKPTVASLGLGFRIDIIIPSGWALAFWFALIMQSPLVGGLRETQLVVFESLGTYVPDINDPDTPAYRRCASKRKTILTNKYFSYSSKQRVNFIKFGIHNPFFCDWKNLTKDWSDVKNFYVLRHFRLLLHLRKEIKTYKRGNARSKSTVQESEFDFQKFDQYKNCLVQVQLSMMGKGTPKEFAIICMPKRKDLRRFEINKSYEGPVEKCHTDLKETSCKILHKVHSMKLNHLSLQLNRTRVKRRRTFGDNELPLEFDVIDDEINRTIFPKHHKIMSDYAEDMKKLYPTESTKVRHSCDRQVMGYVTMGGYSFLRGKSIGIGYVTLPSLLEIIRKKSNIVLVRNTEELQYRLARLEILVDIKSML
ncbi:ribonucleases P/MRP protein subunit POP1 isoform X1 [Camponotus floridanus]|uniref:ribonucleases P/MRP protein subunit POP1 isoform X1 n=1 Tax=Camponotus floridanus TaxID=104421 RepID=UPI000DC69A15|nr:ribonucleases P/MRP protein subunit POP1 isoform X1 [Camponotus floridanus]XP_025266295.1 ribonucleases P/MRP protein subunit POP1 isoform X1 [Camponotus floridanus]XP_025266296.1 ribonucleases P/MRP protein subunit POP1 isoform X1 [Camponotus floridanus]